MNLDELGLLVRNSVFNKNYYSDDSEVFTKYFK